MNTCPAATFGTLFGVGNNRKSESHALRLGCDFLAKFPPSSRHSVRPFPHRSHHVSCVYYFRDNLPVCFPIKVPIHRFSSLAYVCIGSFRDKQRISGLVVHFCHVCVFTRFVSSLNALQRLHVYCICTFSAMSTTYILCAFLSKATLFPSRGKFLVSMRPCLL